MSDVIVLAVYAFFYFPLLVTMSMTGGQ